MLKKAGIVVVAATAGLLAVSPLAFADDHGGNNTNILPIQNNTAQVDPQVCGNQIASGIAVGVIGKVLDKTHNHSKCKQDNRIDNDTRN